MTFVENQLTLNNADQQNPDIYEYGVNNYAVVWQDNRNGNSDIYMYYQNYTGNGNWDVQWDTRITTNVGSNISPKIYNDIIVYQSNRNGNWDIYMYNITSKVETQITTNTANQEFPDVYGDIIVWQDHRDEKWDSLNWYVQGLDIYMYDLTTQTEKLLPTPELNSFSPAIGGNSIVYGVEDYYEFPAGDALVYPHICSYDISTGLKINVAAGTRVLRGMPGISTSTKPAMDYPAIDGTLVAWTANSQNRVEAKDVSNGSTWQSGSDTWNVKNPDVSGNWIAYQYFSNGAWHIRLYDFSKSLLYETPASGHQQNPAISTKYANFIVYQDNRSGHWHIYITAFWSGVGGVSPPAEPITPSRVIGQLQEFKSRISDASQIPTSDFAGANNKVKENRRNTMINQLDSAIASIEAAANNLNLKIRSRYFESAIDQLNDFINKVDGVSLRGSADVAGSHFTPDWITAPFYLDLTVRSFRDDLQTLLNGIS